jgi:L-alanine-DL-glutamate epimerase-like enolase superfamily enzyme
LSCEWYCCKLDANPCGIAPKVGTFDVPQGPGLGIDVDAAVVARYRQA